MDKIIFPDSVVKSAVDQFEHADFSSAEVRKQFVFFRRLFMTTEQLQTHWKTFKKLEKLCSKWNDKQDVIKHLKYKKK